MQLYWVQRNQPRLVTEQYQRTFALGNTRKSILLMIMDSRLNSERKAVPILQQLRLSRADSSNGKQSQGSEGEPPRQTCPVVDLLHQGRSQWILMGTESQIGTHIHRSRWRRECMNVLQKVRCVQFLAFKVLMSIYWSCYEYTWYNTKCLLALYLAILIAFNN